MTTELNRIYDIVLDHINYILGRNTKARITERDVEEAIETALDIEQPKPIDLLLEIVTWNYRWNTTEFNEYLESGTQTIKELMDYFLYVVILDMLFEDGIGV